jgi:hypothetical protein
MIERSDVHLIALLYGLCLKKGRGAVPRCPVKERAVFMCSRCSRPREGVVPISGGVHRTDGIPPAAVDVLRNRATSSAYSLASTQNTSGGAYQKATGHAPEVYKDYVWNKGNPFNISE